MKLEPTSVNWWVDSVCPELLYSKFSGVMPKYKEGIFNAAKMTTETVTYSWFVEGTNHE